MRTNRLKQLGIQHRRMNIIPAYYSLMLEGLCDCLKNVNTFFSYFVIFLFIFFLLFFLKQIETGTYKNNVTKTQMQI